MSIISLVLFIQGKEGRIPRAIATDLHKNGLVGF